MPNLIPNPDPKEVTIKTDSQWFSLTTPSTPRGQCRVKAYGYDSTIGAVEHVEKITDITEPFALLVSKDEEGNPILPLSSALIATMLESLPAVIEEIQAYRESLKEVEPV